MTPENPLGEGPGIGWGLFITIVTGLFGLVGVGLVGLIRFIDRELTNHSARIDACVTDKSLEDKWEALEHRLAAADASRLRLEQKVDELLGLLYERRRGGRDGHS